VTLVLPACEEIKEKTCIIKRTSKNYYNYTKREGTGYEVSRVQCMMMMMMMMMMWFVYCVSFPTTASEDDMKWIFLG
jgi:hypothetical protein